MNTQKKENIMRKLSLFIFIIVCVNMMIVPQSRTHEPDTSEGFDNVHYRTKFVIWTYENGEQSERLPEIIGPITSGVDQEDAELVIWYTFYIYEYNTVVNGEIVATCYEFTLYQGHYHL